MAFSFFHRLFSVEKKIAWRGGADSAGLVKLISFYDDKRARKVRWAGEKNYESVAVRMKQRLIRKPHPTLHDCATFAYP